MLAFIVILLAGFFHGSTSNGGNAHCDFIEVNTKIDEAGKIAFTQVIYWKLDPVTGDPVVSGYRCLDTGGENAPIFSHKHGIYTDTVYTHSRNKRTVSSKVVIYTVTTYDPEFQNTFKVPYDSRPLLFEDDSNLRLTRRRTPIPDSERLFP